MKWQMHEKKVSRLGAYGVILDGDNILLVSQEDGLYFNKFDLPGGGVEFGETIEQTLRRELIEEINATFSVMKFWGNLTAVLEIPEEKGDGMYSFHQIGMIYLVEGVSFSEEKIPGMLQFDWINWKTLKEDDLSAFAWAVVSKLQQA